ncbi:MAG: hypothetical protein WC428_06800 [Candidatus Paceibacterota bacterium]
MSKRRQRCLKALGYNNFAVWDVTDKATIDEVAQIYEPDAMIVCSPPKTKGTYITFASKLGIPVFCEADIVNYTEGPYYPSCSLIYHPGIQKMCEIIGDGLIGKIYTFQYHLGQHIRDWRPKGFDFANYYAAAYGGKEMLVFELSWLAYLLGRPMAVGGMGDKKMDDAQISSLDVYAMTVHFSTCIGSILIDIVSRPAIRELRIVGEKCNLLWNWNNSYVSLEYPDGAVITYGYDKGKAADGYNANICEQMYIAEMQNFIDAIQCKAEYLFSHDDEKVVMDMLGKIEGRA